MIVGEKYKEISKCDRIVRAIGSCLMRKITHIHLGDAVLDIYFDDGTYLSIYDGGQQCCEHRYMSCSDRLEDYVGCILLDIEMKECIYDEDRKGSDIWDDVLDIQFLDIITSGGTFQLSFYNEHNGFYGGWDIEAELNNYGELI